MVAGSDGEAVAEASNADAVRSALRAGGERVRGGALFVNVLPTVESLRSAAGGEIPVRRIVACHGDPATPDAAAGLRAAGVDVACGALARPAVKLNWRYLAWRTFARPAVTLKWAMSLDGRIATVAGDSQWISSPDGRRWALEQREVHDAILVGSGTVLADDPRLDRRVGEGSGPIVRAVMDRRLRTPSDARLLTRGGPLLIYVASGADAAQRHRLVEAGARAAKTGGADLEIVRRDPVTPAAVLEDLHRRGVSSLLVEGGGQIAAAFLEAGLYDHIAVCCAPLLIGGQGAPGPLGGRGFAPLDSAPRLAEFAAEPRGHDFILTAFRDSCLPVLYASVENY